jgi:hypothetical protein
MQFPDFIYEMKLTPRERVLIMIVVAAVSILVGMRLFHAVDNLVMEGKAAAPSEYRR